MDEKTFDVAVQNKGGKVVGRYVTPDNLVMCSCSEGHMFFLRPRRFLNKGNWCNQCSLSKGEDKVMKTLEEMGLPYAKEYRIKQLKYHSYDFLVISGKKKYLIEYDGVQHFRLTHTNTNKEFLRRKKIDQIKEFTAVNSGYIVIRIDYTQYEKIAYHIKKGINLEKGVYYSSSMYG